MKRRGPTRLFDLYTAIGDMVRRRTWMWPFIHPESQPWQSFAKSIESRAWHPCVVLTPEQHEEFERRRADRVCYYADDEGWPIPQEETLL